MLGNSISGSNNKVLEIINAANKVDNASFLNQKIIDFYFSSFDARGVIFFLPDDSQGFSNTMIKNLDEEYSLNYKKYYYKFDPLKLTEKTDYSDSFNKPVVCVDYTKRQSCEYSSDFLWPQGIHYKLVLFLWWEGELLGKMVLTRPSEMEFFSEAEIAAAVDVTPYIAFALANNKFTRKRWLKDNLFTLLEEEITEGIIILDDSGNPIHMNPKAEELCSLINENQAEKYNGSIHPLLLKDCHEMIEVIRDKKAEEFLMSRKSVIQGINSKTFSVSSKVVRHSPVPDHSNLFIIHIEEKHTPSFIEETVLRSKYKMTDRETDVVNLIFEGLHNAEIARQLFVSEITIKKHVQNIYKKVGVNNRTSLINKILIG